MNKRLLSLLVSLGLMVMLGAVSASADQILLGGSDSSLGTVTITCPGAMASCTMSLLPSGSLSSGTLGVAGDSHFASPNNSTVAATGNYLFTGGPNTLQSSNGGISFGFGGSPWSFTFTDTLGDSLTANADWTTFFSVGATAFQDGHLDFSTVSITCPDPAFCTDFSGGGAIDLTLQGMSSDLTTLWNQGGSASNVFIEGGSVTPVPEPGSLALFGSGLIGIAGFLRRKLTRS